MNKGLLVSGMFWTARQTLDNFIAFIEQFSFIPNGSRIYYLNRSHPPFFAHMLEIFYDFVSESRELDSNTKKQLKKFVLINGLRAAIKEYKFWMTNRSIEITLPNNKELKLDTESKTGKTKKSRTVRLNFYRANTDRPRPESYYEDINSAVYCKRPEERAKLYTDLSTAAETGYDFSSRWFNTTMDVCSIQTSDLIPCDLNAILYKTELIIARLCRLNKNQNCSRKYIAKSIERQIAVNALLFNEKTLQWSDFNYRTAKQNENFYISNLTPLFMGMRPPLNYHYSDIITRHLSYFEKFSGKLIHKLIRKIKV